MTLHVGTVGPPVRANNMEPEVLRQIINSITQGTQGVVNDSDLAVTQNGTPNMSVNVASGFAFVGGTSNSPVQGMYHAYNDATVNLSIAASDPTNPRIDVVCLTINDAFYAGVSNTAVLQVITGTPAASPAVPAIPASSISLAQIAVAHSVTSIVTANITDVRPVSFPLKMDTGVLGYAQVTANQTGIGVGPTDLTSLSVTVTVGSNRYIKISGMVRALQNTSTSNAKCEIREGSTTLQEALETLTANAFSSLTPSVILKAPSPGSHTYKLSMGTTAGTVDLNAGATDPAYILVEDIGHI